MEDFLQFKMEASKYNLFLSRIEPTNVTNQQSKTGFKIISYFSLRAKMIHLCTYFGSLHTVFLLKKRKL